MTRSSPHRPSTSTNRAAGKRTSAHAHATDLLLLEELHAHLPVGLLVNDADTLEILHANPPLPGFADHDLPLDQLIESHNDKHQPHLRADELAALVADVAATGRPRHLPEFRHDSLKGQSPKYDGRCRNLGREKPNGEAALRFKAPQAGQTVVDDLIKGRVVFDNQILDDLVILRSNGYPTYNFSVVVDDAVMGITHVVRGDDHLTNTPRQIPIFQALGFPLPQFGHLPMILGPDKARLSKRHGATSIMAYRDMGYLPNAMVNYLVRLGWSHGDQELFSREELIQKFSWKNVQTSAAIFNPDKLLWLNAEYLKTSPPEQVAQTLVPLLEQAGLTTEVRAVSSEWLAQLVVLVKERAKTLMEMVHWVTPYFGEEVVFDEEAAKKFLTATSVPILTKLLARFEAFPTFSKQVWEESFKKLVEEEGIKMGQLAQPVRVALTGRTASPGLFEVMEALGRERTLLRLRWGIEQASRT